MVSQRRVAQLGLAAAALVFITSVGILITQGDFGISASKGSAVGAAPQAVVPMVSLSAQARPGDSKQQ
jgi:hypothetical protein